MERFIVLSGLPASGKTTLGRILADQLGLAFLDKDDYLESLYESRGVGDKLWRSELSREADAAFKTAALKAESAVLVSWWKHPLSTDDSGTDIDWLLPYQQDCVEVYCQCDPGLSFERFTKRTRHPGHLDDQRDLVQFRGFLERQAKLGALGVGRLMMVGDGSEEQAGDI